MSGWTLDPAEFRRQKNFVPRNLVPHFTDQRLGMAALTVCVRGVPVRDAIPMRSDERAFRLRVVVAAPSDGDTLADVRPAVSPRSETLGAALLRKKDFAGAEKVFRADLERTPNNPRSLFGLAKALKAQKKPSAHIEAAFKKNWQGGTLRVEDL